MTFVVLRKNIERISVKTGEAHHVPPLASENLMSDFFGHDSKLEIIFFAFFAPPVPSFPSQWGFGIGFFFGWIAQIKVCREHKFERLSCRVM